MSDPTGPGFEEGFTGLPLSGKRIVVTRSRAQSASLTTALFELGADVIHFPVIEIADPPSWEEVD